MRIYILFCVFFSLVQLGICQQRTGDIKRGLIEELESIPQARSGIVEGTMTIDRQDKNSATRLVNCDFKVWHDGDSLRIERGFGLNLLLSEAIVESEYWTPVTKEFDKQVFLSNQTGSFLVTFKDSKPIEFFFLPVQYSDRILKNIDLPPFRASQILLDAKRGLEDKMKVVSLGNSGDFLTGRLNGFFYNYRFFSKSPRLLEQLSISKKDGTLFYKLDIAWSKFGPYNCVGKMKKGFHLRDNSDRFKCYEMLVEYRSYSPEAIISPRLFQISSMDVVEGTKFLVPNSEHELIFDGLGLANSRIIDE